jgi:hypothetical protein
LLSLHLSLSPSLPPSLTCNHTYTCILCLPPTFPPANLKAPLLLSYTYSPKRFLIDMFLRQSVAVTTSKFLSILMENQPKNTQLSSHSSLT